MGKIVPHHAVRVDGKIVPHDAVRVGGSATFADRAVSADSRPEPDEVPMSDPVGKQILHIDANLGADGLGPPFELEGVAVLAVLDDDQVAEVEAVLRQAAEHGQDVRKLYRLR